MFFCTTVFFGRVCLIVIKISCINRTTILLFKSFILKWIKTLLINKKCYLKSILDWFLKNHVKLKTSNGCWKFSFAIIAINNIFEYIRTKHSKSINEWINKYSMLCIFKPIISIKWKSVGSKPTPHPNYSACHRGLGQQDHQEQISHRKCFRVLSISSLSAVLLNRCST